MQPPPPPPPRPFLIELDTAAPSPADAPPVPEDLPQGAAMLGVAAAVGAGAGGRRRGGLGRLAALVLTAFGGFVLSVAVWDFVAGLLARNSLLGGVAMGLAFAAVAVLVLLALREVAALSQMARVDGLRARVVAALAPGAPLAEARAAAAAVEALYAGRADLRWARARLAERQGEMFDGDAVLRLAEAELMAPLDRAARAEVEAAARRVAVVTALVPLALADVAVALAANLAMVRRLAEIYGGRAGGLGSWRLMRKVLAHLVATGALALTDDLIGSVAGGGVVSKLSRRFGEGVVNGALTARVGVAAMEVCRPMPFVALPRPGVGALVSRALTGLMTRG